MLRRLLIAWLVASLPACDGTTYTKDRLSQEQMAEMVAGPLEHAQAGDLDRARREFEALRVRARKDEESDLLTAFGVGLFMLAAGEEAADVAFRRAAIPYLERAVPATADRFGDDHPEVALALNTYGDALRSLSPDDPPRRAEDAYARAYAIRQRRLGRGHAETLFALYRMAQVKGLPSRTGGDPARIEQAAAMFREVIRGREVNARQRASDPPDNARLALAEMYLANGRMKEAVAAVRTAELIRTPRDWRCDVGPARVAVAAALREAGRTAEAEAALQPPDSPPPDCFTDPYFRRDGK